MSAMPPDRWRQVSHLYHAALAREDDRAAFLDLECAGDAMRHEVQSLVTMEESMRQAPMRQIDPKDHHYDGAGQRGLPEGRK